MTQRKQLQRIISIEEDHLPQLLDRPAERQLTKWSEEDENISPQMETDGTQAEASSKQTPSSPRGQPVGKETLSHVRTKIS